MNEEFEDLLHKISTNLDLSTEEMTSDLMMVYQTVENLEYLKKKYNILYNISLL
jgi:DNA-directed RNA polymerase delta subunit